MDIFLSPILCTSSTSGKKCAQRFKLMYFKKAINFYGHYGLLNQQFAKKMTLDFVMLSSPVVILLETPMSNPKCLKSLFVSAAHRHRVVELAGPCIHYKKER